MIIVADRIRKAGGEQSPRPVPAETETRVAASLDAEARRDEKPQRRQRSRKAT